MYRSKCTECLLCKWFVSWFRFRKLRLGQETSWISHCFSGTGFGFRPTRTRFEEKTETETSLNLIIMFMGSATKHEFYCSVVSSEHHRTLGSVCATGLDLDLEESSSLAGGSEDQQESSDSASFSIPSLELSDGVTATGNSLDVDDGLSSSYSALAAEGRSPSTEVPSLRDDEKLEAAGETSWQL